MRKESESENRVQLTMAKQQGTLIEVHNLPMMIILMSDLSLLSIQYFV